jgi:peptide/nickel transport system substrate-binding protein
VGGIASLRLARHTRRRVGAALTAALVAVAAWAALAPAPARGADEVVLTVGTKQDVDSMSVYSGVLLSSYEVWNLQYAVLVDLTPNDLSPTPQLAESWTTSADGLTWTYKLRPNVKWSDGKPLTSEDVRYTLLRMRDEEWANFFSFVEDYESVTAPDPTTVVVTTKKPNPQLPFNGVYILPKHQWDKYPGKKVNGYAATDPVVSGPFRLTDWKKGNYFEMKRNPNYFGTPPAVDTITFRIFKNDEAMAAALRNGEIDALHDLSPQLVDTLKGESAITTVDAEDGTFAQITMNTGSGPVGNGHPALQDVRVRRAINQAIDRNALTERVLKGLGRPGQSMEVSVTPKWNLKVPAEKQLNFDPAAANQALDDAGYTRGSDGVRTMPGGGKPLDFRFYYSADNPSIVKSASFVKEWLADIGIETEATPKSEDELTPIENKGQFDLVAWNWVPYGDPSPQLSYLTCSQVPEEPDDGRYNDAFWCDDEYDQLYDQQSVEMDPTKRVDLVHQALQRFYDEAPYAVMFVPDTVQAYRNDRFTGWVRQPADTGPIMFSQSSPSYALIEPVSGSTGSSGSSNEASGSSSDSDDGGSSAGIIVAIVVGVIVVGGGAFILGRRRTTVDERE